MLIDIAFKAVPAIGKAGWKVLVPAVLALAGAVGFGVKGGIDLKSARANRKQAERRLDQGIADCELVRLATETRAREYGAFQLTVHAETVGRFADWLERNEHLVRRLNFKKVDGVRIRVPNIPKYVSGVENVVSGISGLASAVGAGVAAQAGALWGVSAIGTAGTGAAISSLSGAAATNATLAWLGGGTLAAGGGGVAAGGAVLGVITIVPMLLIGGMTVGIVGAKSKTKSRDYLAKVDVEIERIGLSTELLRASERRMDELRAVLSEVATRTVAALDALEALDFSPETHASEFLRALQLVTAVKEILNTPILDPESGELTEASAAILRKYS